MPGDVTSPPAGEAPRTEAGRALLDAGSFPDDEGPSTWWSPGDLTPDRMRECILVIEREAASTASPNNAVDWHRYLHREGMLVQDEGEECGPWHHRVFLAAPEGLDVLMREFDDEWDRWDDREDEHGNGIPPERSFKVPLPIKTLIIQLRALNEGRPGTPEPIAEERFRNQYYGEFTLRWPRRKVGGVTDAEGRAEAQFQLRNEEEDQP